jgi:hypothetical protein
VIGRHHVDQALVRAEQMENPADLALTLAIRGWLGVLAGDWQGARADLDQAAAVSRQAERSWYSPYPLIFLACLSLAEGDRVGATAPVQEAIGLAEANGDLQALRLAAGVLAELEILEGRAEAAEARLLPLLDRPGLEECDVTGLLPVLAWAQLQLWQLDEAAETVEAALRRALPEEMRLVVVEALRVQALVALRRERWDAAAVSLEEGLALSRDMPYPYAEARLLQVYGSLHAQHGEPEAARERLEAAQAIFAQLGARQDRARVEQALGALSQNDGLARFETAVSDAQWAQVQALLPPPARTGRRRADDRRTLEAILYRQRTGYAWAKLPAALGDGATAHRRWQEWQAAGLWEPIAAVVGAPPAAQAEPSAAPRRDG